MNILDFKAKWSQAALKERSAAQEHFIDLCHALGFDTPAQADPEGTHYTFERGVRKTGGGQGFADIWYRGHFAWEYKGQKANLEAAYAQLRLYIEDLENPPLLVVCDLDIFEIHTNFTNTAKQTYRFDLASIDLPENLRALRALWTDPDALRPQRTVDDVTKEAADRFGALALALDGRGVHPERAAHFLVQILFCLFAEDVGLLPRGLFGQLLTLGARNPALFPRQIEELFAAMRDGGVAGYQEIERFNGGLFAEIDIVELTQAELEQLRQAAGLDWTSIEPAIIGTLFERSLDPARRSQLGAHYTGRADIERVVEPVIMWPLRRRWEAVRTEAEPIVTRMRETSTPATRRNRQAELAALLSGFRQELTQVSVLDPACGSGNFLYVALNALLDLEKEVISYGAANGLSLVFPEVRPTQLYGLELNRYAQELTQVVVWIGYLQWMTANGFAPRRDPVLGGMDNIRLQDALLDRSDPNHVKEATWPAADYIIGNPPFLGGKRIRSELGDEYVAALFQVFGGLVRREADLCIYFFEKARNEIALGISQRAGLLATQAIRAGANRHTLDRIKQTGDIFLAWADEEWVLNGADVRISIVGFDDGTEDQRCLDGRPVETINVDLSGETDVTLASQLTVNRGIAFQGPVKVGAFDIEGDIAAAFLAAPLNPNGRPNGDVVRPWLNAMDITRRPRGMYIIDFGNLSLAEAALYEWPFEYVAEHVRPLRESNRDRQRRTFWWRLGRSGADLKAAIQPLPRYICTPRVAKHRTFVWVPSETVPDSRVFAFARDDDYFFGVLHSRAHEVWALRTSSRHGVGNDPTYNTSTCFETFPFPCPSEEQREAIGAAAKRLNELREAWLNPPDADEATLKKRTLTNLYNQRPSWLANAHATLDQAVWAAYGWPADPADTDDETILARLLALNIERAAAELA